jgi:hypothetical protein
MRLRELWWDWNPKKLRRLLKQAQSAIDANANGWSNTFNDYVKWRKLAIMMSHFDTCTSARIDCKICSQAREAYVEALSL